MPVSKELGDPIFVAPQTTAVGMQIMDPIPNPNAPQQQAVDAPATLTFSKSGSGYVSTYRNNQLNAFDVLLNGRSYTFDLPAYTNGYQVKLQVLTTVLVTASLMYLQQMLLQKPS